MYYLFSLALCVYMLATCALLLALLVLRENWMSANNSYSMTSTERRLHQPQALSSSGQQISGTSWRPHGWLTLIAVAGIWLLAAVTMHRFVSDLNISSIASSLFQVSGTIAALVLPAAELAGQRLANKVTSWNQHVKNWKQKENAMKRFDDIERATQYARLGSVTIVCSFLFSTGALLFSPGVEAKGHPSFVDKLFVGGTLSCLIVGFVMLLPFTWSLMRFQYKRDEVEWMLDARVKGHESRKTKAIPTKLPKKC